MKKSEIALSERPKKWIVNLIFVIALILALGFSFRGVQVNMTRFGSFTYSIKVILRGFTRISPDFLFGIGTKRFEQGVLYMSLQSLAIAFIGTLIGAILAIPFSFLASKTIVGKHFYKLGIGFLVLIRVFPPVILVIVLVKGFGANPLAVTIAIGLHSIGMLGKLFSETIDNMDRGPIEALDATGASTLQKIRFGIFPQILPELTSATLYRLDINVRSSSILGIVGTGAGGYGALLYLASQSYDWTIINMVLVAVIVLVLFVDTLSSYLRKKLV